MNNDTNGIGQQFTFPPPPPAPSQSSQEFREFYQRPQKSDHHGGRGNRGDRGHRGLGRGYQRGNPRNSNYGHPSAGGGFFTDKSRHSVSQNGNTTFQGDASRGSSYPLPNYPTVQLPQYPVNLGQDYGRPSPRGLLINTRPSIPQAVPSPYAQISKQYHDGQQSYPSNAYNPPVNHQPVTQAFQSPGSLDYSLNGHAKHPVSMGPPIRMGFNDYQAHKPAVLPQSERSWMMPVESGKANGTGPSYQFNPPTESKADCSEFSNTFTDRRGRGSQRGTRYISGRARNHNHRPRAAPAVPSFGAPLPSPSKPLDVQDSARKPRRKQRRHNQLGLTPRAEEHESSDEEDDADEETRLGAVVASSGNGSELLRFEYNGFTSTLQSASDIASWIEERKKRYPTKARAAEAAERKRQRDEVERVKHQARRESTERRVAESKQKHRQKVEADSRTQPVDSEGTIAKTNRKIEKLRKQLQKEEKRAARAVAGAVEQEDGRYAGESNKQAVLEGDGAKKRKRADSNGADLTQLSMSFGIEPGKHRREIGSDTSFANSEPDAQQLEPLGGVSMAISTSNAHQDKKLDSSKSAPDLSTPMSQPSSPVNVIEPHLHSPRMSKACDFATSDLEGKTAGDVDQVIQESGGPKSSSSSSEISSDDLEDFTSSSGTSSPSSDSASAAPDLASSKRNGPERVLPPKRGKSNNICRDFLKSGRCKRGNVCHYRHELPERGSANAGLKKSSRTQGKTNRIGLHQRVSFWIAVCLLLRKS